MLVFREVNLLDEKNDPIFNTLDEKKCRLNVVIEDTLYKDIKYYCNSNDVSISEITRKMWKYYLKHK